MLTYPPILLDISILRIYLWQTAPSRADHQRRLGVEVLHFGSAPQSPPSNQTPISYLYDLVELGHLPVLSTTGDGWLCPNRLVVGSFTSCSLGIRSQVHTGSCSMWRLFSGIVRPLWVGRRVAGSRRTARRWSWVLMHDGEVDQSRPDSVLVYFMWSVSLGLRRRMAAVVTIVLGLMVPWNGRSLAP